MVDEGRLGIKGEGVSAALQLKLLPCSSGLAFRVTHTRLHWENGK